MRITVIFLENTFLTFIELTYFIDQEGFSQGTNIFLAGTTYCTDFQVSREFTGVIHVHISLGFHVKYLLILINISMEVVASCR